MSGGAAPQGYFSFFRIGKETPRYQATDMSGKGGLYVGGRWHEEGNPCLYAAGSVALAVLETLVHYEDHGLPALRKLVEYQIPMSLVRQGENVVLPPHWDDMPTSTAAQKVGTEWLRSKRGLLLFVPSVIVKAEANVVINTMHPDLALIKTIDRGAWTYDSRLL
ncbi:RES family NAD+ phosphorylase [Comamonas sp. Tr-654]|uniref:RES family NAD+ phosphorylase n=1 Tax=Comamonas sp. Tr-654 TaxID=2608341 RepID=UPI001420FB70|nr:RES family NAD+ phosphorylase [Comamonas sp. Tr-654]